jgi:uncharacterized membrane protein
VTKDSVTQDSTRSSDERGAIIPFLALCISVILLVGAFTVDLGRAMLLRRDLQQVADVVSLDASKFLTGATATSQLTTVRNAAARSATRNHWTLDANDVHLVQRSGTTWNRVDNSTVVPDGVEVVARGSVSYNFQPGGTSTTRSAVATRQSAAGVEIGTNLGTIDTTQATMLNRVFGLFGGNSGMNLSLVSWQGLAGANVTLGDLVVAAGSADTDSFLETSTTYGTQLQILARALTAEGNTTAAGYVDAFRTSLGATVSGITVKPGDFLSVSTVDPDTFAAASLNAFSLLQGELFLARRGSALSGTFSSGVLGIASVTLTAQVVQPPSIAFGPVGTTATNGQIKFSIGTSLAGIVATQLGADAATGTATLTSVACSSIGPSSSATARVQTNLAGLSLTVANLPVTLGVTAVSPTTLTFSSPFTWAHSQHVGATSVGLTTAIGGAVAGLGTLVNLVAGPLVASLDNLVLSPILRSLGVSLAGADVAVLDPVCLPTVLAR